MTDTDKVREAYEAFRKARKVTPEVTYVKSLSPEGRNLLSLANGRFRDSKLDEALYRAHQDGLR